MTISLPKTKTFKFPYTRVSAIHEHELAKFKFYPLLKIALKCDSRLIKIDDVYIDTGSQWCLFNKWFAKQLGIEDYKLSKWDP